MRKTKIKYIVGVDEVGRGPIAGPVALGAVLWRRAHALFDLKIYKSVKDSKQLSPKKREKWFEIIKDGKEKGLLDWTVVFSSVKTIDSKGLSYAINRALAKCLEKFKVNPKECLVLLDGSLYAPKAYINQKTIIKGDEKEPVIALASIAAKVTRDKRMVNLEKKYPGYGFSKHKGYGTSEHYTSLTRLGISAEHRRTFLSSFKKSKK